MKIDTESNMGIHIRSVDSSFSDDSGRLLTVSPAGQRVWIVPHYPDLDDTVEKHKRLNSAVDQNGTPVSTYSRIDGFSPYWFTQQTMFQQVLVPLARYREVLEFVDSTPGAKIVDPPDDLTSLVRVVERFGLFENVLAHNPFQTRLRRLCSLAYSFFTSIILAIITLLVVVMLRIRRRDILLYGIDHTTSKSNVDFRIEPVHDAIKKHRRSFIEIFHYSGESQAIRNILKRRRLALYPQALCFLFDRIDSAAYFIRHRKFRHRAQYPGSLESRMEVALQSYSATLSRTAKTQYVINKFLLKLSRPRFGLFTDDYRHIHSLTAACKQMGIPSIGFQHGTGFNKFTAGIACYGFNGERRHNFDAYGLWSKFYVDRLLEFSELYEPDNIFVFGPLRSLPDAPEPTVRSTDDTVRILLVSEPWADSFSLSSILWPILENERYVTILKCRPQCDMLALEKQWGPLLKKMTIVESPGLTGIGSDCDVVVGSYSSLLDEAIAGLVPVIVLDIDTPYKTDLHERDVAAFARTSEELVGAIEHSLSVSKQELRERRQYVWGDSTNETPAELLLRHADDLAAKTKR